MTRIDIDGAIRLHNHWRRQFINAFAGGDYADMPLSEHRGCTLESCLSPEVAAGNNSILAALLAADRHFHALANEIIDLSNNGLGDSADLLLPDLNEAAHRVIDRLGDAREPLKP
ncbi:MAG: hypothetical protein CVU18_03035 [Betaproteobacteria bacterium HGW-Betaproteobacteria-12]|nr:MAG: hypothetical protein CVU18_03035 [Betaproteobacteria bacterium HGW-Betaproteobacteria-12]